jgi:hypothetical protein
MMMSLVLVQLLFFLFALIQLVRVAIIRCCPWAFIMVICQIMSGLKNWVVAILILCAPYSNSIVIQGHMKPRLFEVWHPDEHIRRRKPCLEPYSSEHDERFTACLYMHNNSGWKKSSWSICVNGRIV